MAEWKSQTTAEHVVAVTEAVNAFKRSVQASEVSTFLDITPGQTEAALGLAVDLGLLTVAPPGKYLVNSPLCRLLTGSAVAAKATVLRIVLEPFEPFVSFRERWLATADPIKASSQAKQLHALIPHRDEIKETFLSLATYTGIFLTRSGGQYQLADEARENSLLAIAASCADQASAEQRVRILIGPAAAANVSRDEVIDLLATALRRAAMTDGANEAVTLAGNAVESYLFAEGSARGLAVATAHGLNAKLNLFYSHTPRLIPEKLIRVGNYLGHVRNAADHGIEAEIGVAWTIRANTGLEYVFVSCSFISSTYDHLTGTVGVI
jgi:hypothetical protein